MAEREKIEEAVERLSQMGDEELVGLFKDANAYDGSFDFADSWGSLEELVDAMYGAPGWETPFDAICRVFFGDVTSLSIPVRLDAYGNVEHAVGVAGECRDNLQEMAEWLADGWSNVDLPPELEEVFREQ